MHAAQEGLGDGERQRRLAARAEQCDAPAEDLDGPGVLSHDCAGGHGTALIAALARARVGAAVAWRSEP